MSNFLEFFCYEQKCDLFFTFEYFLGVFLDFLNGQISRPKKLKSHISGGHAKNWPKNEVVSKERVGDYKERHQVLIFTP